MQDYAQAWQYVAALTQGDPSVEVLDWRALHDQDKSVEGHARRGTLPQMWNWVCDYNNRGYGIFCCINIMDGIGRDLSNVQAIRVQVVDLDNLSSQQNYERATVAQPAPGFAVVTSVVAGRQKYHVYWQLSQHYAGNDRYNLVQRKLRQVFDGDKTVIDPTRVLRVPGTLHLKDPSAPFLVTCHALAGFGTPTAVEALETALAGVVVIEGGGGRHELGDPDLAAPSLDWVKFALDATDPNQLDRGEWFGITCAIKQAGWSLSDPDALFAMWSEWCAKYEKNDLGENLKQWNSIRNTELGWKSLVSRIPSLKAAIHLGGAKPQAPTEPGAEAPPMPAPPPLDCSGTMLTDLECREWFKGCVAIERMGEILVPSGRFMNPSKFNLRYGGKQFIWTGDGKTTDEPWKAATRSQLWTIPKVDHTRFLPGLGFGEIIHDQLGRPGVNTYIPIKIRAIEGDVHPWLRHMELMLPVQSDREIFYAFLAHSVKFPGEKIPWAPLIQSTEGVGKGFIMEVMERIFGEMYCYSPKAQELVKSGSTFNAWMRAKLFIIVNEIMVDEKRELVEILKPMITDRRVEVQSKGIDQEMEDNFADWLFFSNFKNAIPVGSNGRRYAIFYSAIQSARDLMLRQMGDAYFAGLFNWMRADGAAHIAYWLLNYPIERGAIPQRAPETSSMPEARRLSRGPIERLVFEAVEDARPGFRGGFVSAISVGKRMRETGARAVSAQTVETILMGMGYQPLGRAPRCYFQEDKENRPYLFHVDGSGRVEDFGVWQGWE